MRGLILSMLVLVAGCATKKHAEDQPATAYWDGQGIVYETARPAASVVQGNVTAELTLVELDEAVARELLGIAYPADIAPKSFRQPMGEIAAVNACYGYGRLLARPSIELKPDVDTNWQWNLEHVYLHDWKHESKIPVFEVLNEGVDATLKLTPSGSGDSISLKSVSAQLALPIQEFTNGTEVANTVTIQLPDMKVVERVGTETLNPGETAMFQLGRAPFEDRYRIRLLFVRLVAAE
jgi:hypothetical protein